MYGLKGPLKEKLRNKPPLPPIALAFESATTSEKKNFIEAIKHFSMTEFDESQTNKDLQILINVVAKYYISTALKIHREIIKETRELISQISNSDHRNILNRILASDFLP